jgi:probable rRNA maturation factor
MLVDRQRKIRVARKPLEKFLRRIRKELELGRAEVCVAFVSDAEIAQLNWRYRRKKGATDVLSFPAGTRPSRIVRSGRAARNGRSPLATRLPGAAHRQAKGHSFTPSANEGPLLLGDIAIAPATARRYAKKNGRTLASELRVLMLHGVLHLLGYDHEVDTGQMNRIEQRLRRRLGLA